MKKKKKTGECLDCGAPIRQENHRCQPCYFAYRKANAKVYLCDRCGKPRSRTADTFHCMACAHQVRHEEYLATCQATRENYDYLRERGLTNHQAMQRLMASEDKAYSVIHRRLALTKTAEKAAA